MTRQTLPVLLFLCLTIQPTATTSATGSLVISEVIESLEPSGEGERKVADTKFSVDRGFYIDPFTLEITTETEGATIRYTLDGSTPSPDAGAVYASPIAVTTTTVLRAMAYKAGLVSTNVDTQTYLLIGDVIHQPASAPGPGWPEPTDVFPIPPNGGAAPQRMDYEMDPDVTGNPQYADRIEESLLSLPSISVVTDLANLFDATTGIYANPEESGRDWERIASVELLHPGGPEGFQVDGGLRIRGGVSTSKTNPKHSFRFIMRSEYGDSKIEYPLLGEAGPEKFDKIDFRTAQNFSWNFNYPQYATWLEDPFTRDTMRDMGHPSTGGFFFHLYLNGVYWGLYQIEERPDATFGESYLGGDSDDYDVLKSEDRSGTMVAVDGNTDLYHAFWSEVDAGVASASDYFRLLGTNPDGTVNPTYPRYLDEDNLIDYMLIVFYTGALDMPLGPPNQNVKPRNLYTLANRVSPTGFKFLPHDNEWSLMPLSGVYFNRVNATLAPVVGEQAFFNPWWLHERLKSNPEYAVRFADRVRKHFLYTGALTPEACTVRYQARLEEIDLAMIAESARWGDTLNASFPRTRDRDWLSAVNWVRDSFINAAPQTRTEVVLGQLQAAGLYPFLKAPDYSHPGGTIEEGYSVAMTAPAGSIYFTTDGTDPRQIGGSPSPSARSGESGIAVDLHTSVTLKSRALSGETWSALNETAYVVPTNTPTPSPSVHPTSSPTPSLFDSTDLNRDFRTDKKDLLLLFENLRIRDTPGDLTHDGNIDGIDIFYFSRYW